MQTLPAISISENMPVIFLPLTFILIATAIKDYWEDYKRKKSDREENMQKVLCFESGQFTRTTWRQLRVGNIIKVKAIPMEFFFFKFQKRFFKMSMCLRT